MFCEIKIRIVSLLSVTNCELTSDLKTFVISTERERELSSDLSFST